MRLNKLSIKDKAMFEEYLKMDDHQLCVYSFPNMYIWKKLYDIEWQIINNSLCIFFKDSAGVFLYLPPLGTAKSTKAAETAFEIMDELNSNTELSRIENAEDNDIDFYIKNGYLCKIKSHDYIYSRTALVDLKGDRFKSKRASVNYFRKNYEFLYLEFSERDTQDCLRLYDYWMRDHRSNNPDPIYQGMLKDSLDCLNVLLKDYKELGVLGRIVKIKKDLKAFTFGFELNRNIFCILYEVTDLSIKGLSQFIFREFCSELDKYNYINVMDDSGLENLKKVKLSYRPQRLVPAYIIKKQLT